MTNESSYSTPLETTEKSLDIKKSRFIASACMVLSRDDVKLFLKSKINDYPDARHHCWAYVIGNPNSPDFTAMNDAGEPSGTAGRPILNVIQHKKIGNIMVVVSRYFGGIKLGAGGLTRAYSNATELLLSELKLKVYVQFVNVLLVCDFSEEQIVRFWSKNNSAFIESINYSQKVEILLKTPKVNIKKLSKMCLANGIIIKEDTISVDSTSE